MTIKLDLKKPGLVVDQLYALRARRLEAQAQVDEMKAEEQAVKNWLIDSLPKSELTKLSGKLATAALVSSSQANVIDWHKLHAYVEKHGAFELLQRRVSIEAVREVWDEGKDLPGVERYTKLDISLTKASKST
jgi:hypothetical protein